MSGYNNETLDRLEPSYMSGLALNKAPFTSAHQDEFFYMDAERDQRDNMLHHLTQYSNLLLIVTGERGIGKSSLLKRFVDTANDEWSVCEVQANAMMDAHQLLANIARGFGLQVTNQPAAVLQDTLYQYLVTIQRNDQVPILVVDDAHELPKDALETLFTLADAETGDGNLLRIILFCEPQIEIMLESPSIQPLRERITHTMDIPPFSEEQTAEYIKHRLAVSGFTGTSPFKPKDIKKIYKVSHGVPARINELAHLHLSGEDYAPAEPEHLPEEFTRLSFNKQRIVAGALVIALVVAGLLFQNSINNLFEDKPDVVAVTAPQKQPSIIGPLSKPEAKEKVIELAIPEESKQAAAVSPLSETPEPFLKSKSTDIVEPSSGSNVSEIKPGSLPKPVIERDPVNKPIQQPVQKEPAAPEITTRIRSTLPNPVPGSNKKQSILVNGEGFSEDTNVIVSWSGNTKKLDKSQISYENRNQIRIHVTVGNKADNWTVQANDPVNGKSNIHNFKVTAAPVTGLQTAQWINQQKPDQFTLQLLGTYNKYSLTSFVKQHQLEKDTAYFVTQRNGRNWYTLVHGRFATRDTARQAINSLPDALQKTQPWIRRFDGIQSITKTAVSTTSKDVVESSQAKMDNSQPASLDLTAHAAWLWSQNPQHFTIQLLGSHNLEALRSFMQQHQLEKQVSFYRTRRDGKQWFVLLHGSYPDRSQAKAAIEKLPAEIRKSKPWPRRFLDIHNELSSQ